MLEKSQALHETMLSTQAYLNRQETEPLLIELKFEEIFLQVFQNQGSEAIISYFQALYSQSLFRFKDNIEKESFQSVEEMIKKSKLSPMEFRKLFKQLYAQSPKEWLLKTSLKKAKHLLEEKELNVSQIAMLCEFNSLSWFIKSFKQRFGITPKKYQQNYQKSL